MSTKGLVIRKSEPFTKISYFPTICKRRDREIFLSNRIYTYFLDTLNEVSYFKKMQVTLDKVAINGTFKVIKLFMLMGQKLAAKKVCCFCCNCNLPLKVKECILSDYHISFTSQKESYQVKLIQQKLRQIAKHSELLFCTLQKP